MGCDSTRLGPIFYRTKQESLESLGNRTIERYRWIERLLHIFASWCPMPFPAAAVANEFLTIANDAGEKLTPMKLQKLVYFAHGWYLALTGEPLVLDRIEAWQYGPVIPTLYQQFKGYGNEPVESLIVESRWVNGRWGVIIPQLKSLGASADQARKIISKVWTEYGKYSAARLSNATHQIGSPWQQVYQADRRNTIIPDETIATYFRSLAHAAQG